MFQNTSPGKYQVPSFSRQWLSKQLGEEKPSIRLQVRAGSEKVSGKGAMDFWSMAF